MLTKIRVMNHITNIHKYVYGKMFVDAIEASANNRPIRIPVAAKELTEDNDIIELMKKIIGFL